MSTYKCAGGAPGDVVAAGTLFDQVAIESRDDDAESSILLTPSDARSFARAVMAAADRAEDYARRRQDKRGAS